MSSRALRAALAALALAAAGCGTYARPSREPFLPSRYDYEQFRGQNPDLGGALLEPNYLPFVAHRMELAGSQEDVIVFCRWSEDRFPLSVYVYPPSIGADIQSEFKPQDPALYVDAAWQALASWQQAGAGAVSFERAANADDADLRVELVGQAGPAPEAGVQVLGTTPLARACRVRGRSVVQGRLDVTFRVPVIRVFVADQHGLLPPDQVERNVLHEMGHALGMRGHSPIPADLMYEVARDRRVSRLSGADANSLRALYAIPNGTLYARMPRGAAPERPAPSAPTGPLQLSLSPYVDERLGFSLHVPPGWRLIPAPRGVVAIDGLAWDYEGSFQVIVHGYPSIASYVRRHGQGHVRDGRVLEQAAVEVAGHPAFRMRVAQRGDTLIEEHLFVETGDGRLIVVIEESPADLYEGFAPWFGAILGSFQVLPAQIPGAAMPKPKPAKSRARARRAAPAAPPPPAETVPVPPQPPETVPAPPPPAETVPVPSPPPAAELEPPSAPSEPPAQEAPPSPAPAPAPVAQPPAEPEPAPKPRPRRAGPGVRR
jgi:predicted Zn-dependent protease